MALAEKSGATEPHVVLKRHLDAGEVDAAFAFAAETAKRYPQQLRAHLLHADVLEHIDRREEVLAYCEDLRKRFPDNPMLAGRTALALAGTGRGEEALGLYRSEIAASAMNEGRKTSIARRIAVPLRRSAAAAKVLAERAEAVPDNTDLLRDAGVSAASVGDFAGAVHWLDSADRLGPLPVWMQCVRFDAMQRLAPTTPEIARRLGETLIAALRENPHEPLFVRQLNRLHLPGPVWRDVYALVRRAAETSNDSFLLLETAIAALQARDRDVAQSLLERLEPQASLAPREEQVAQRIRPLARVLRTLPPNVWEHHRIVDDVTREMQVVRVPGAQTTLVVFLTLAGNFMMLPVEMLDSLLTELPMNVVYLRDTTSPLAGAKGFRMLGPTLDEGVAAIGATLAELGAARTVALGASGSGFSAIRYGARLGVDHAVVCGPITSFDIGRSPRGRNALHEVVRARTDRFQSLEEEVARAPAMTVDLYYGAACERDIHHASRVDGQPGFRIIPVEDVEHHYCVLEMLADGSLLAALRAASLPA